MMQITAVLLWQEHYHFDKKQVGYLFACIGLASAVVQGTMVGKLSRLWGEERMLIVGLGSMMIGLALIPFSPSNYFFQSQVVFVVLLAFGSGCSQPALMSLLSRLSPINEQGQILGINMSFGSLARVVGPLLGGLLYELNFHFPFVGGALLCLSAYGLLIPLHNRLRALSNVTQTVSTEVN